MPSATAACGSWRSRRGKTWSAAINNQTAMMLFYNNNNTEGRIQDEAFVQLGKKHGIPTLNDAAADVPPVDNLWKYTKMGFDLVAFSGGKGLRGPQSAGLLLGRKDLIAAARLNAPPNGNTIGRGLKVNKEEMLGMLAALERYLAKDHAAERREFDARAEAIRSGVAAVPGIKAEIFVPEVANHVPHVRISWDAAAKGMTAADAVNGAASRRAFHRNPFGGRRPRHRRLDDAAGRGEDRGAPPSPGAGKRDSSQRRTMSSAIAIDSDACDVVGWSPCGSAASLRSGSTSSRSICIVTRPAASRWRASTPSRRMVPMRTHCRASWTKPSMKSTASTG